MYFADFPKILRFVNSHECLYRSPLHTAEPQQVKSKKESILEILDSSNG